MNKKEENPAGLILGRRNYVLLGIGFIVVVIGYILMAGGKSEDPNVFSEELFSAVRITVAPILVLTGLTVVAVSILIKPKE